MSVSRRLDDGWDEGRRDARGDFRSDPWPGAGSDVNGTGGYGSNGAADQGYATATFRPRDDTGSAYSPAAVQPGNDYEASGYPTGRYDGANAYDGGNGYGAQAGATGYGGQAGASGGYPATAGYPGNSHQESAYGQAGYGAAGHTGPGNGGGGYGGAGYGGAGYGGAGYGAAGYGAGDGGVAATSFVPEFSAGDANDAANDGPSRTPRPVGRLSIFTLLDDKALEFDRHAERAAEGVRTTEPDTLVYVIHVVPKAPMQRIIYEIYRDRAAFDSHERQSHIQRFVADRASCVLATNIIDLRLKYAKVAALGGPAAAESPVQPQYQETQSSQAPRALEQAVGTGSRAPFEAAAGSQASFTPANDRYAASSGQYAAANGQYAAASEQYAPTGQYATAGRGQYSANGQYGYSGDGGYSANGNGQYPAANGYSAASAYPDATEYPATNGYSASNGYSAPNEYSAASGYSPSGYSGANGQQAANGYQGSHAYQGTNGQPGANGYQEAGTAVFTPSASAFTPSASAVAQYPDSVGRPSANGTGHYRELGSGATSGADADGYQDPGGYQDPADRGPEGDFAGRGRHGSRAQPVEQASARYNDQRYGTN